MKKFRFLLPAALGILCLVLAACSSVIPLNVSVMVEAGEGYRVTSENPVTVPAGQDAVFTVEI